MMLFESLYQSFEDSAAPETGRARISSLRKELAARKLDGFIVPRADEHQGEYVPASAERLAWLTDFTGSAGTVIILAKHAAIFIDGRYTLQVRDQVDVKIITPVDISQQSPSQWLNANAKKGARIAYDPWLMTPAARDVFANAAKAAGATLAPVASNPVDAIWTDRPAEPA
ncbi:MAG: aminopeptidase P family protein, partial [Alphaproteobacteria bacterium]|nr:aminopeptidase P family protein [Alphaproteobacteria bacterium]